MVSILLVEDDATVREAVGGYLRRSGHEVTCVGDGVRALEEFAASVPDLVLLDLMLPGMSGFDVLRRLRALRRETPVIMLTARGQEHERVAGLQAGADDYVTKPFSLRELELRVRSVVRRSARPDQPVEPVEPVLTSGDLTVDRMARRVLRGERELMLTAREFDLLAWLVAHPGVVAGRDQLIREVWGWEVGDESTVTVHVRRLREKVEPDPSRPTRLVTVFGRGYRWDVPAGESG